MNQIHIYGLIISKMAPFPWEGELMESDQLIYSELFLIA